MKASLICTGLWAGPIGALEELDELKGLEVVVSCLPIGTRPCDQSATEIRDKLAHVSRWEPGRELRHRILVTSDTDASIPLEHLAHILADPAPTLIHCNAGKNRSTAVAACWLLLHRSSRRGQPVQDAIDALNQVSRERRRTSGQDSKVYAQMENLVHLFARWLKARA